MPKNVFVLVGPPTSGKTTQAIFLEETTRAHRIRGRDIVPELSFALESERDIVPDDIFLPWLQEALDNATNSSLIMDNIPRTAAQAKLLAEWADTNGVSLNVIKLDLNEDEGVDRAPKGSFALVAGNHTIHY